MPFFNRILIRHNLFFLYPTIFPSQFEPLFGLPKDMLFVEDFWSRSINSRVVFYRFIKLLGFFSWLFTPMKHSRSYIKHYLKLYLGSWLKLCLGSWSTYVWIQGSFPEIGNFEVFQPENKTNNSRHKQVGLKNQKRRWQEKSPFFSLQGRFIMQAFRESLLQRLKGRFLWKNNNKQKNSVREKRRISYRVTSSTRKTALLSSQLGNEPSPLLFSDLQSKNMICAPWFSLTWLLW